MSFCCCLPTSQDLILQQKGDGGNLGPSKKSLAQLASGSARSPTFACLGMSSSCTSTAAATSPSVKGRLLRCWQAPLSWRKTRRLLFSLSFFSILHPTIIACCCVRFSSLSLFFLFSFFFFSISCRGVLALISVRIHLLNVWTEWCLQCWGKSSWVSPASCCGLLEQGEIITQGNSPSSTSTPASMGEL